MQKGLKSIESIENIEIITRTYGGIKILDSHIWGVGFNFESVGCLDFLMLLHPSPSWVISPPSPLHNRTYVLYITMKTVLFYARNPFTKGGLPWQMMVIPIPILTLPSA